MTSIRNAQFRITTSLDFNNQKGINLLDPTNPQDAATKAYVDAAVIGVDWKPSVRAATVAAITLSAPQTVDGVVLVAGDRVLVKDQAAGANNGIYVVAAGAWTRALDADTSAEVTAGMAVFVEEGTVNADSGWLLTTNAAIVLGTTALVFTQFTGVASLTAGNGLTKTGNTIDFVALDTSLTVAADSVKLNTAIFIKREVPTGLVNGANTVYTLANTPVAGTDEVFLNGLLQDITTDYGISGATITFVTAPATGDSVRAHYIKTP